MIHQSPKLTKFWGNLPQNFKTVLLLDPVSSPAFPWLKENAYTGVDMPLMVHEEPASVDTELFEALVRHAAKLSMLDNMKKHNCINDSEYTKIKNSLNKQYQKNRSR